MPIPIILSAATDGLSSIPHVYTILKVVPWVLLVLGLKYYFGGARNKSERLMHSKVIMVTVRQLLRDIGSIFPTGMTMSNAIISRVARQESEPVLSMNSRLVAPRSSYSLSILPPISS